MNLDFFISNNDKTCGIIDDSDSDTSTTSDADDFKSNQSNKSNINSIKNNELELLLESLVKPIGSYSFYNKWINKEINDGFELSLFRFLHIMFSTNGRICFNKLTKYMDKNKSECVELEDFLIDNPGVMTDSDFYSTEAGIKIRIEWYNFLSSRTFFTYVHESNQIFPSNENFYSFVSAFFPLVDFNILKSDQDMVDYIYKILSSDDLVFTVNYQFSTETSNGRELNTFDHFIKICGFPIYNFKSSYFMDLNSKKLIWTKTQIQ